MVPSPSVKPDGSELRAQIAVVGSGPGGAVAAALLARAGLDVLLIEEGSDLPLESAPHFSREEILQKYRNAGISVVMGGAKVAWVEGRCVGGGSEINRGLYHRTPEEVLERWSREFQVVGLTGSDLQPHFEACEQVARVSYLPGPAPPASLKLREGADNLGWKAVEVPRLVSYTDDSSTASFGRKQSVTETFIPRFLEAGGRLLPDTRVRGMSRRGGRWLLRAAPTGGPATTSFEISAETVFVACGAVQTPALLRRSGVTRNVGDTLRYHPMVKVVARFPEEVNIPGDIEPVHQIKEFDPRFSMGCSVSKRPALALALVDRPQALPEVDLHWRHMAIYYVQSTGGVATVRPLPGFRDPLVRGKNNPADMRDLAEGLRRLAECLFAAGAVSVYPGLPGVPALRSMDELRKLPSELPATSGGITTMHLFSSCPMGEDLSRCATDSFGRVTGAEGLYISDASLLCGPTIVNPQGTVMAVAHRVAQRFVEKAGRGSRLRPASGLRMEDA